MIALVRIRYFKSIRAGCRNLANDQPSIRLTGTVFPGQHNQ